MSTALSRAFIGSAIWLAVWYAARGWPIVSMLWALSAALRIALGGSR